MIQHLLDTGLVLVFAAVLGAGVWLTYLSRGIQFRALARMWQLLCQRGQPATAQHGRTISPRAALLTAMSTTIGVGNIAGPLVAIGFGGPGALLCYVLASIFGGAVVYSEVALALKYRQRQSDGSVRGGPMQYIRRLHPAMAPIYGVSVALLLLGWSASNANTITLAAAAAGVSKVHCGAVLAALVVVVLMGGIRRIARMNELLVPTMCAVYCFGTLSVIFMHASKLPHVLFLVLKGFANPRSVGWGVGVQSTVQMLRWGLARAMHANEAGVGTSSIPHSMSHSATATDQATLAMAALYFNGLLCMLTGVALLVSGPFAADTVFNINLLQDIFTANLSSLGGWVLGISIFLFCFGTIIGNSFNGSQCFMQVIGQRGIHVYYMAAGAAVFAGSLFDLRMVWSLVDYLIVPVSLINTAAVMYLAGRGQVEFAQHFAAEPMRAKAAPQA